MAIRRAVEESGLELPVLLLAGFVLAMGAAPAPSPVTVTLGATSTAPVVALAVGRRLEVRLPANPTTGYAWTATALHGGALASSGPPAYLPAASGLLGAGGTAVFTYRAVAPAHLSFAYARSWERAAPPG